MAKVSVICRKIARVMKKFSFLDKFCLTDRFLEGKVSLIMDAVVDPDGKESVRQDGRYWEFSDGERVHMRFAVGDSVVVMMSYKDAGMDYAVYGDSHGWHKKRCANEKYLPNRFVVEGVRCVRVQDLGEEDALRAGVWKNSGGMFLVGGECGGIEKDCMVMFRRLFDKMFRYVYADNPWVVVYDVTPVIGRKHDI